MRKNATGIAAVIFGLLAGASTLLCASTGAPQAAGKPAPAADTPFIAFVKKVIAAAPGDFATIQGKKDESAAGQVMGLFLGKVTPDAESECLLFPRNGDKMENPPHYSCKLGGRRTLQNAKPVFENAVAELRAAFPDWKFAEKRNGDESKRTESWQLYGQQAGFSLRLTLLDMGYITAMGDEEALRKPGVEVALSVTPKTAPQEKNSKPEAK
jgi:hypothetical protein